MSRPPLKPRFGGAVETLLLDLGGRRFRIVIERRGPAGAPLWLLLPALSTVSSRSEWRPLAEAVAGRRQLVSFDWPGFGESDRPALPYDAELLRSSLRGVLSVLQSQQPCGFTVVAAGHGASIALGLAAEWSGRWERLVAVAPTWRGPLPSMTGWPPRRFRWLRQLVQAPLLGPLLYRLNTSRAVLRLMLRRHVWLDPALLTPEHVREQQRLARGPGARFASVAFVSGALDPAEDRAWWLERAERLSCPLQVVLAAGAPPRSRAEMEALAPLAERVMTLPGRLGLHQEAGAELARLLLEPSGAPGGRSGPAARLP